MVPSTVTPNKQPGVNNMQPGANSIMEPGAKRNSIMEPGTLSSPKIGLNLTQNEMNAMKWNTMKWNELKMKMKWMN